MVDDYCWLPEEFPDQVFFLGQEEAARGAAGRVSGVPLPPASSLPGGFPYDVESSLSPSPLGSAAGTDSEDEEYEEVVAGLTQKMMMARSSLGWSNVEEPVAWRLPTALAGGETHKMSAGMREYSPQSTLSPTGSWTALGMSPTDPDYLFLGSRKRENSALDLLSAAAVQVERMRLNEGAELRRALAGEGRGLLPGPNLYRKNVSVSAASFHMPAAASGFYANPTHTHQQQLQSTQLPPPQQQRPGGGTWGPRQNRVATGRIPGTRPVGPSWSLPSQQQQQQPLGGSGMRAVFLGGGATPSGTGVFLPRRDGNPPASKKKSGCSTVLLPARVVQALNLNLDDIGALPVSHGAGFLVNSGEVIRARKPTLQTQQQRIQNNNAAAPATTIHHYPNRQPNHHDLLYIATKPTPAIPMTQELRLPPEWSY